MDKETIKAHFHGRYEAFYGKYLPNAKKAGNNEYKAICPFHKDSNPSFNFNSSSGEFYCHGCGKKGNLFHFYAQINSLDSKHDFGKVLAGIARDFGISNGQTQARLVKTYDYTDTEGNLVFQVCRYDPKTFKQRRPNGDGTWSYDLKDVPRVLYRLPEVIKADEVLIVEGEKDADNVAALGFPATSSPMGARKWRDEYNEPLTGKNVVLIPDNDDEGREHMAQVGASLNGFARSLKWIDLPDLPLKGDVSDWIARFPEPEEAAERLAIIIEQAKTYEPRRSYTVADAILEFTDYDRIEIPEKKVIVHPIVCEQQIILVSGWRGVGKSWFALGLLDTISRALSFGPWKTVTSVPCLYLDGEMAAQDPRNRLRSLNPYSERKSPLYVYSDAYANTLGIPRANLLNEVWRSTIKGILADKGIKLWIVDNIASLARGIDENSKQDWDPINGWLVDLRFAGITTILLHHTNKEGGQRGTSAREDNLDLSLILKQPPNYVPENGADFVLTFSKSRVSFDDLPYLQDTRFQLQRDESGKLTWTWGSVKAENKREVLRMLDEGARYDEITSSLGISKGYVSRIRSQAIDDGYLSSRGKLTDEGASYINNR